MATGGQDGSTATPVTGEIVATDAPVKAQAPFSWKVTTEPELEPVTLDEARLHLRVTPTTEDTLISALIQAARGYCEAYENRAYVTQTITANYDRVPGRLALPRSDAASITSVKYLNELGAQVTLTSTEYALDNFSYVDTVYETLTGTNPSVYRQPDAVQVVYVAGVAQANVSEQRKSAIKLVMAHLYEHREENSELTLTEMPLNAKSLLSERVFS